MKEVFFLPFQLGSCFFLLLPYCTDWNLQLSFELEVIRTDIPVLVLILGEVFSLLVLAVMSAVDISQMPCSKLGKLHSIPRFLSIFIRRLHFVACF